MTDDCVQDPGKASKDGLDRIIPTGCKKRAVIIVEPYRDIEAKR
jgi:hypothetical protein